MSDCLNEKKGSSLFQVGEDETEEKNGTQELLAWPLLRIRCIRKRNGGK
jgi:hypothetical protein